METDHLILREEIGRTLTYQEEEANLKYLEALATSQLSEASAAAIAANTAKTGADTANASAQDSKIASAQSKSDAAASATQAIAARQYAQLLADQLGSIDDAVSTTTSRASEAAASAAEASTSAGDALSRADAAFASAEAAGASAAAAVDAAAAATSGAAAVAISKTQFDNKYYGVSAVDPATRPDGSPCQNGDEYQTTTGTRKVFSGGMWAQIAGTSSTDLASSIDATKGAALAGFSRSLEYTGQGTVARELMRLRGGADIQSVHVGDSLTNGMTAPNTTAYPTYLQQAYPNLSLATFTNVGVPGSTFAQMSTRYATEAYPKRPVATGSVKSLLFVWIGANDFAALPDPSAYVAALEAYWSQAKTDGFTVIAFTIMERNNANDLQYAKRNCRAQINSLIRASKVWDALVDVDGLFPPGSQADTSLFIDGTHLTDAGNKKLAKHVAAIVSQNSNPLPLAPGPTSFVPVVTSSMKAVLDRASFTVKANTTLSLANAIAAIGTGDYTIEWWAYNPTGGADGTNSVLNKSGGSGFGYFSTASATAEGKLFVLPGGSKNWSAARLLSGYYNHNVIKRSGTTVSFYINNILVGTAADTNTHTALNQMVLTVGKYARLRAYSRALSDAEVEAKYGNLSVFDSAESSYLFAISDGSDNLGTQIQDLSASRAHINLGANAVLTMPGPVGQFKFRTVGNAAVANAPTGMRLVSYTLNVSVAGGGSVNSGDTNGGGDYQNAALTTGLKVGVMTNPFPASGTIFINAAGYTIDHTMVFHKL